MYRKIRIITALIFLSTLLPAQGNESLSKIGESSDVSYVMYTDNSGNLYYITTINHYLNLMKYELESGL